MADFNGIELDMMMRAAQFMVHLLFHRQTASEVNEVPLRGPRVVGHSQTI